MSVRECGDSRIDGGVYIEGPDYGPGGSPVEDFLIDPPRVIDLDRYGIIPQGQHLVEFDGVMHVADIVGEGNYPYPWDYVREVAHGSRPSRKTSLKPEQLGQLTPGVSRLMLLHRKAQLNNRADLVSLIHDAADRRATQLAAAAAPDGIGWAAYGCPQHQTAHGREQLAGWLSKPDRTADELPCCVGLWRLALDDPSRQKKADHRSIETADLGGGWYSVRREMACGARWTGFGHQDYSPDWGYAIFAVFPIWNVAVVDPGHNHLETLDKVVAATGLPVERVDE